MWSTTFSVRSWRLGRRVRVMSCRRLGNSLYEYVPDYVAQTQIVSLMRACRVPRSSVGWRVLRARWRPVLHARLSVTVRHQVLLLQSVHHRPSCHRAPIRISWHLLLLLSLQASHLHLFKVETSYTAYVTTPGLEKSLLNTEIFLGF